MLCYCTTPLGAPTKQISFEDILKGEITNLYKYHPREGWTSTITRLYDTNKADVVSIALARFVEKHADLIKCANSEDQMASHYHEFKIPKRSGGYRTIDDPDEELRKAHAELKAIIEDRMDATYHTAAFAYVKGRCAKDAVIKHQMNKSNWCLRTDFSNFFGSITLDFAYDMLTRQYPFCEYIQESKDDLKEALKICFLRGGLPQGSVISPFLTNIIMIPIDYKLANNLWKENFVYTRYADDIQISAYRKFDHREIVRLIDQVLESFGAPFRIKPEKTKFSSVAGVNYMLGLNLNKDHNVTVGHERKKMLKAMLTNFLVDFKNGKRWPPEQVRHLDGICSYYRSIEKDYIDYVIQHIQNKFSINYRNCIKSILG